MKLSILSLILAITTALALPASDRKDASTAVSEISKYIRPKDYDRTSSNTSPKLIVMFLLMIFPLTNMELVPMPTGRLLRSEEKESERRFSVLGVWNLHLRRPELSLLWIAKNVNT